MLVKTLRFSNSQGEGPTRWPGLERALWVSLVSGTGGRPVGFVPRSQIVRPGSISWVLAQLTQSV